ncbi:Reverse transcriptase ribonuclease h [Mycena indigotica]|uniref:Reverse transcriptase ribonuclease h n=1 Tax=Mycena indigotica TaxID=2126181 RepID=A0A8H6WJZ0_9AGAR|nr:Reverse transcriptase ribonuclease h [Mycena indigotica]KAF7315099.1 Reverse transcriptase ribonuclease h [Mycena indigotica]
MVLDIAKFHRTCPILPAHKRWFVLQGPLGFYIDHCCPFGCASSSSNAGLIGSAIIDIWEALGFAPANRYEDDIMAPLRTSGTPPPAPEALLAIQPLCIPWHPTKWTEYLFELVYIGFLWNFPNKTVALPEDKRLKFLKRIHDFRSICKSGRCQLLHAQKIHGSLCHISFVHPQGRSYLPALTSFIIAFEGNTFKPGGPRRQFTPPWLGPRQDRLLFVDASTAWGIGLWLDGCWGAWKGTGNWKSRQRHIGWLETVAIELLVLTLESLDFENAYLLVHSDNQGVIGAFDKGRSRNPDINLSLRRIFVALAARNIALDLVYIPSANNPADPLSRGILPKAASRISPLPCLPSDLATFFVPSDLSHHLPPPVPMPRQHAPQSRTLRAPVPPAARH